jgi:polyisoprenoid-binding protein YceI
MWERRRIGRIGRSCGVGLALAVLSVAARSATHLPLDSQATSVRFACEAGLIAVHGRFQQVHGHIALDETAPPHHRIRATIVAASLTTGQALLDSQLKAPGFFDALAFPVIEFESHSRPADAATPSRIEGTLTLKGVSRPIVLDVAVTDRAPHLPVPGDRSASSPRGQTFLATTQISRSQFGMTGYEFLVGDDCGIRIEVDL